MSASRSLSDLLSAVDRNEARVTKLEVAARLRWLAMLMRQVSDSMNALKAGENIDLHAA